MRTGLSGSARPVVSMLSLTSVSKSICKLHHFTHILFLHFETKRFCEQGHETNAREDTYYALVYRLHCYLSDMRVYHQLIIFVSSIYEQVSGFIFRRPAMDRTGRKRKVRLSVPKHILPYCSVLK